MGCLFITLKVSFFMTMSESPILNSLTMSIQEMIGLIKRSEDSDWTPLECSEIAEMLDSEINQLKIKGEYYHRMSLVGLLAPAGPVQEIAMANGWEEEFIKIANRIDRLLGNLPFTITFRHWQVNMVLPILSYVVILFLTLVDGDVRSDILSLNGCISLLVVTIVGYLGTWIVIGRHTISVSSMGVWLNDRCLAWDKFQGVQLTSIKIPTVTFKRVDSWIPVIGVLRVAPSEAAMHIDLVNNFLLEPQVVDATDKLDAYKKWRSASINTS